MFEAYIFPILLVTGCGLLLSAILVVAAKFMAVKTDETYDMQDVTIMQERCVMVKKQIYVSPAVTR